MKAKRLINIKFIKIILFYWIIVAAFNFISGEEFKSKPYSVINTMGDMPIGELLKENTIEQAFYSSSDDIQGISLYTATYDRINIGTVIFRLLDSDRVVIYEKLVDVQTIPNNQEYTFTLSKPLKNVKNEKLILQINSTDGIAGNAITFWYSPTTNLKNAHLTINNNELEGSLSMSIHGRNNFMLALYYWYISFAVFLLLIVYLFILSIKKEKGIKSFTLNFMNDLIKYKFLVRQLVSREFKTKYKRSALGMFWSILNPLLTMLIQYIVFSTIFKSDIPNYPVYLLTGIVLFGFFSEAILTSLQSIVNNASLITKVYVPKYIYPVTKIFSSGINLFISLIPLFIVIIITQTRITKAFLLLPFGILCLTLFCVGLGLILASAMVFFRDTQFLWGVVSMLWMYSTPIFYPESIIPVNYILLLKLNPLYHYIRFARIAIIQGVSPEPKAYLACIIFAVGSLLIGSYIFKKAQNKFVLYI